MSVTNPLFVFDSDWHPLSAEAFDDLAKHLKRVYPGLARTRLKPNRLMSRETPFYPGYEMIRLTGFERKGLYPAYFLYDANHEKLIYLDGRSEPIHALNKTGALRLDRNNYRQYLMFFGYFVHGQEGPFFLIDSEQSPRMQRLRLALQLDLPPLRTRDRDDDGWTLESGVIYGQQLFRAAFRLEASGVVEMLEDEPLEEVPKYLFKARLFPDLSLRRPRNQDTGEKRDRKASHAEASALNDMVRFMDVSMIEAQYRQADGDNARQAVLKRCLGRLRQTRGYLPLRASPEVSQAIEALREGFPNFVEVIDFVSREMTVSELLKGARVQLPPFILSGPPGVGKTRFLHDLAKTLQLHLEALDIASATAGFELSGSSSVWRGGRPGAVMEAVLKCGYVNPMIFLDELDKLPRQESSPLDGPLYALLERVTAQGFQDEYLKVRGDFSRINWVAACNDFTKLSLPIRSRFICFQIQAPQGTQLGGMIQSIYADMRTENELGAAIAERLSDDIVTFIARTGAAPRDMKKLLRCAAIATIVRTHRSDPGRPLQSLPITLPDVASQLLDNVEEQTGQKYLM